MRAYRRIEWQKVERVNVFDYDGDMIGLKALRLGMFYN